MLDDISMLQKSRGFNLQQMITNQTSEDICRTVNFIYESTTNLLSSSKSWQYNPVKKEELISVVHLNAEGQHLIKHWLLIFEYRRSYNTQDSADKFNTA